MEQILLIGVFMGLGIGIIAYGFLLYCFFCFMRDEV